MRSFVFFGPGWALGRFTRGVIAVVLILGGSVGSSIAQRFLPDDPLWADPDRMDMPLPVARDIEPSRMGPFEFLRRTFGVRGEYAEPAVNVNTVEGVPNSSWYTNRHYRNGMSEASLQQGPNMKPGPAREGTWRVVDLVDGASLPRAIIRDSTDRRFEILFDAAAHPEMATGAAMIGSRLLHALGYNVPGHWLRTVPGHRLVPAADSITGQEVDSLLALTSRTNDAYRAVVTRIPDVVRRIGPFRFRGTRPDDANDVFPHEHRRELRGLRVFAAWVHHSKLRSRHTLDVGVREDGRQFVRHFLTDLHLTLGSGGASPKPPWSGHEYVLELDQVLERVATLGLSGGDWAETDPPDWPALGHFGSGGFEPRQWRPEWPNPSFQRCDSSDAFWAAKQVRHFTRGDLQAIVATGEYSSPAVANYILLSLLLRRDAIAEEYLHWGGGLDRFSVQNGYLTFVDLRARYGLAGPSVQRTATWRVFHNQTNRVGKRLVRTRSNRERLALPPSDAPYLRVRLETRGVGETRVFLRRTRARHASGAASGEYRTAEYEVVGIERSQSRGSP